MKFPSLSLVDIIVKSLKFLCFVLSNFEKDLFPGSIDTSSYCRKGIDMLSAKFRIFGSRNDPSFFY